MEPGWLERLQFARYLHSCCRIKAPVHFDEEFGIRSNGVPYRLHQRYCPGLLCSIEFIEARAKRIKLECSIPFLDHTPGGLMKLVGSAFDSVPAIGVRLDSITYRPSKELIHRLTNSLPHDVPAGNFDDRDGGHRNLSGTRIIVSIHALHQILAIRRGVTTHVVRHSLRKIA